MSRRSPRKKAISPEIILDSDDEDFAAVASDDPNDEKDDSGLQLTKDKGRSLQDGRGKAIVKHSSKHVATVRKNRAASPEVQSNDDDDTIVITPPPTPSPVKAVGGKKRAIANCDSDEDDDVFVPSPTRDSPKKARAKEPSTPSKVSESARKLIFDSDGSNIKKGATSSVPVSKSNDSDSTVFLEEVTMRRVSVPELDRCQIYNHNLVDPQLKTTYKKIPRLPRMADYAPSWGPRSTNGGFRFSATLEYYESPDMEYLKQLISFTYDKKGNIANLSRIDPSLLGVKNGPGNYLKNILYLYGLSSQPLLCFSVVLITRDNHEHGRTIGSDQKTWVLKDVAGVMLTMELERFIAVLGLVVELPYVPDDSARKEEELLHLGMVDNAFTFSTTMMEKIEFDKNTASSSSKSTPKAVDRHSIFAPASPAFSSKAATVSWGDRKQSLKASDTVPFYDGRKRQLEVPKELSKIPIVLPRYDGEIPEYSLALVAYTVSSYCPSSGPQKDQVKINLSIHFGVVLHEPVFGSTDGVE